MTLPWGAEKLIELRAAGKRPVHPVIVSLCGWTREANPQVVATRDDHDFTFLAGLEVIVYVSRESQHVSRTLRALAGPAEWLHLWDVDEQRGFTIWPIWGLPGGGETAYLPLEQRRNGHFVRWQKVTWFPGENRRFAA